MSPGESVRPTCQTCGLQRDAGTEHTDPEQSQNTRPTGSNTGSGIVEAIRLGLVDVLKKNKSPRTGRLGCEKAAWSEPREIFAGSFPATPDLAANDQCSRNPNSIELRGPKHRRSRD